MKLAESIDLFQRRFAFHVVEHHIAEAYVFLKDNNATYYIHCRDVLSEQECTRLQTMYLRLVEDYTNVNIKVISNERWNIRRNWIRVWSADGSTFKGPHA